MNNAAHKLRQVAEHHGQGCGKNTINFFTSENRMQNMSILESWCGTPLSNRAAMNEGGLSMSATSSLWRACVLQVDYRTEIRCCMHEHIPRSEYTFWHPIFARVSHLQKAFNSSESNLKSMSCNAHMAFMWSRELKSALLVGIFLLDNLEDMSRSVGGVNHGRITSGIQRVRKP